MSNPHVLYVLSVLYEKLVLQYAIRFHFKDRQILSGDYFKITRASGYNISFRRAVRILILGPRNPIKNKNDTKTLEKQAKDNIVMVFAVSARTLRCAQ